MPETIRVIQGHDVSESKATMVFTCDACGERIAFERSTDSEDDALALALVLVQTPGDFIAAQRQMLAQAGWTTRPSTDPADRGVDDVCPKCAAQIA